tara:strand:- start:6599 stop:7351 length:753 start_codon:yes stop_codon:yes gene_type:complete
MDNHFKIIVPLYNVEKWIQYCINSIKAQTYENFECIIIDDISTDNSVEKINKIIKNDKRFKLVVNKEKKYALKNIYDALLLCQPANDDIVVTVDGDDWLASKDVLEKVNKIYKKQNCWMTYGSYMEFPSRKRGKFSKQIPHHIIKSNSYRKFEWCSSHLRTFKFHLWRSINKEDFINTNTGEFIKSAWDLAFMFPMLEMSADKAFYIKDVLYVYNRENPLNEDKVDHVAQLTEENYIRNKKVYNQKWATR